MHEAWLKCKSRPGLFSDELVVEVETARGRKVVHTVPSADVVDGRVRVTVFDQPGVLWAKLPTDHPYHPIPVRAADLSGEPIPA